MLKRERPPPVDFLELNGEVRRLARGKKELFDGYRFWKLYGRERGIFGWRPGNPHGLSRRRWIEKFVHLTDKGGKLIPFILNDSQRRLEAQMIRMERAGVPVRIVILKARQQGFSTFIAACELWFAMTVSYSRSLIIAHRNQASTVIFDRVKLMQKTLSKDGSARWTFKMTRASGQQLALADPFFSTVVIESAEVEEPARSDTVQMLHISEASSWKKAEQKANAVLSILPDAPGTYGFNEATARGPTGWFCGQFKDPWKRQRGLSSGGRTGYGWVAMFFPWFFHQEYRWTVIFRRDELPRDIENEIMTSLDDEERWLLEERYLLRGRGWVTVDVDQLAWRRHVLREKFHADVNAFNQENPSTPEKAFGSSGNPIFDPSLVEHQRNRFQVDPLWRGSMVDPHGEAEASRTQPVLEETS